jgi:hypothetical protein
MVSCGETSKLLSKEAQTQSSHIAWFHLQEISRIGKSMQSESRLLIAPGWGGKWQVTA